MRCTDYPEFRRIEAALLGGGDLGDPSELHGTLCAVLAVTGIGADTWVRQVIGDGFAPGDVSGREAERVLHGLYAGTVEQLWDTDLGFYPLLPGDDEDIAVRTRALANWCSGFLYGLGATGISEANFGDEETADFVRDLGEIARVSSDPESSEGSEENDYAEVVEYVRMGAILVATQFKGPEPDSSVH